MQSAGRIRDLRVDDDFELITRLRGETLRRLTGEVAGRTQYRVSAAALKELFFPSQATPQEVCEPSYAGFVVEEGGVIVAFMGVGLSEKTRNGYLMPAFAPTAEHYLPELLTKCSSVIRGYGGDKCMCFATLLPGQVRNGEISFWERYGFASDEYFQTLIRLDVREWNLPSALDTEGITVAAEHDLAEVAQILYADGEESLAETFSAESTEPTLDHVFLTMRNGAGELAAMAYYKVAKFQDRDADGRVYDGLGAWEVGVHFRPGQRVPRTEKRRFIQAVLASMKQLDVIFASARISSRDFEAFVELLAQGFYFQGDPQASVRLARAVDL